MENAHILSCLFEVQMPQTCLVELNLCFSRTVFPQQTLANSWPLTLHIRSHQQSMVLYFSHFIIKSPAFSSESQFKPVCISRIILTQDPLYLVGGGRDLSYTW